MPTIRLTDRLLATAKTTGKPLDYFDRDARGLNLRVTPNGIKTWFLVFSSPRDGKRARVALGHYPATKLADARARAIEARAQVEAGIDPRGLGKTASGGMTVADFLTAYIKSVRLRLRSANTYEGRRQRT